MATDVGKSEGFGSHDFKLFDRQVSKKFKGNLLSSVDTPEGVGCGSYRVNMALTEAFPRGYMHEIFALNGVGKTTFALEVGGQHQTQQLGPVGYLDVEGSLNSSLVQSIQTLDPELTDAQGNPLWMYREGLVEDAEDKDDVRVLSGEECLQWAEMFLSTFKHAYLIIDSVDALVPDAIMNNQIGEATMGKLGKLLSDTCRKFHGILKKNDNGLIWINQVRENPGKMFGNPQFTPGGNAIRFYSAQRLELTRGEGKDNFHIDDNGNILGHLVKCNVVKNKLPTTNNNPYFWLKYGEGIDRPREIAELALELGVVEKEKNSFYFNRGTDKEVKVVGQPKALSYIHSNPSVLDSLERQVMDMLGG
jgi:recombination protein RecA